jgi:hypothetical protein
VLAKKGVLTMLIREDKYPKVPKPLVVDCRVKSKKGEEIRLVVPAERYPKVPKPLAVDCRVKSKKGEETSVVVPADK